MKGKLHKTEQGWIVRYNQEDPRDPLPELPLHPEYQTILPLDLDLEGKEVEFDWCVIVEHYTGKGKEYAKLIQPREKISDDRTKLHWKTSLVVHTPEISDEEIEKVWEDFRIENPNTIGGFQDQYKSFLYGIQWCKEQLKKKQKLI